MKTIRWSTLFGAMLLPATSALAQSVTLEELLEHITKTSPELQSIELGPKFAELDYTAAVAEDWNLFSHSQFNNSHYQRSDTSDNWRTSNTEFGVWKFSPTTGVRLTTSYQYQRQASTWYHSENSKLTMDRNTYYNSNTRVSVNVPVWNNAFGYASRRSLEQREINLNADRLRYQETRKSFLAGVSHQFITLCVAAQRAASTQNAYQRAADLAKNVESRAEANNRARYAQHAARFEREMAAQSANARAALESTQVGMSTYYEYQRLRTDAPECDLFRARTLTASNAEVDTLIEATRRMQGLALDEHALQLSKEMVYDDANPRLDLQLNYEISGQDNDNFRRSFDRDSRNYNVALAFNYPLGNTRARSSIDRVDLLRITFDNHRRETKLQMQRTLRTLLVALREGEHIMATQKQRVESARSAREQDMRALAEGHLEIGLFEDSLRDELDAELALTNSAASYQTDYLSFQEITDQLSVAPPH